MPTLPVTRARTANFALMVQRGGMGMNSGNRTLRISLSLSAGQAPPSSAPSFLPSRKSCGATKQPFHIPLRSLLALASSSAKPLPGAPGLIAKPSRTSAWFRLVVRAAILASHHMAADQFCKLIAGVDAAAPGIGLVVDAGLVEFRRVDAGEPV